MTYFYVENLIKNERIIINASKKYPNKIMILNMS